MNKRALVVDANIAVWQGVRQTCRFIADVQNCGEFQSARRLLLEHPPDLLVTNLRLGAYNGLHLVYLARLFDGTRSVVYSNYPDFALFEEAQRVGAFLERSDRLALALPAYLRSSLPPSDRRRCRQVDRRIFFRGGRRITDVAAPLFFAG